MQLEQLSIFESINYFQPLRAKWLDWIDNAKMTYVMAVIPDDALSPMENNYSGSYSSSQIVKDQFELWSAHTLAISWTLDNKDWGKAADLLEHHRESKQPIKMRIIDCYKNNFERTEIVEYLERGQN